MILNIIAETWMHCMLAAHDTEDSGDNDNDRNDFISDFLSQHYEKRLIDFIPIQNDYDFAYVCKVHTIDGKKLFCITRGTHGGKAWKENFDCHANGYGMHNGFSKAANRLFIAKEPHLKDKGYSLSFGGHSRGGPISFHDQWRVRDWYGRYSKCITYCDPKLSNKEGAKHLKGLDRIRLEMPNDIVDNVGCDAISGVHVQKKTIKLGKYNGKNFLLKLWNLLPGTGHAYSTTTEALKAYFYSRKMDNEAKFLDSIRWVAKI